MKIGKRFARQPDNVDAFSFNANDFIGRAIIDAKDAPGEGPPFSLTFKTR